MKFQRVALHAGKPITENYLEVKENNLSLPDVITLYQSKDKTVWMGTQSDGLIAYRGTSIKHYRHEPGNRHSLPSNAIHDIWEEDLHTLWISTGSGLVKYNSLTDSFSSVHAKGVFVRKGPDGKLYTSVPGQGLHVIDTLLRKVVPVAGQQLYAPDGTPYGNETMTYLNRFAFDKEGVLWAIAKTKTKEGLFRWEEKTRHWIFLPPPVVYFPDLDKGKGVKKRVQPNVQLLSLYIDDSSRVWCGGWMRQGLMCYDKRTGNWQQYYFEAKTHLWDYNTVLNIYPVNPDEFWIGTSVNGFLFNHRKATVGNYTWLQDSRSPLPFQKTHTALTDHCGNYWLSTEKGIFKYNPLQTGFGVQMRLPVEGDRLTAFTETAPGHYLMGNAYRIADTDLYHSFVSEVKNGIVRRLPFSFPEVLHEFIPAGADKYYAAGRQIYLLDLEKGRRQTLKIQTEEPGGWNVNMEFYRNILWNDSTLYSCSRTLAEGLIRINLKSRKAFHYKTASGVLSPREPQDNGITRILRDSYNRIWCGAGGLDIFYPGKELFEHYTTAEEGVPLTGRTTARICETGDRLFYLASDAGVFQTRAVPGTKASFTFITNVGVSYWITADKNGRPWVGTPQGVFRIDPATKSYKLFTEKEGWYWNPLSQPFRMGDGRFVMHDGAVIDPTDLPANRFKPSPGLTAFLVAGQPYPLDTAIAFKQHIRLSSNENFFSVRFTCNNYINEESNTYRYQLKGVDKDWVEAGRRTEAFYTALSPGEYHLYVQAANHDGLWGTPQKLLTITIDPAWFQTLWFKVAVAFALLSGLFAVYRQHLLKERAKLLAEKHRAELKQQEAEVKQLKAEFEKQLAQTEMAALRSQMNPHFIFNCLNSIKLYTVQNDTEAATEYLTKFSRLMRLVLENSRTATIPLSAELEALRLYIDLEVMRFKQKLSYSITVADDVDMDFIEIPPLLLQPYVENAIWHGLMQKEGGGHIAIAIVLPDPSLLDITITDNGIGREKAAELKSKSATLKKSFGMKVTSERITLINQIYKTGTSVSIQDLVDSEGHPAGTEVSIKIPLA